MNLKLQKWQGFSQKWGPCMPIWHLLMFMDLTLHLLPWQNFILHLWLSPKFCTVWPSSSYFCYDCFIYPKYLNLFSNCTEPPKMSTVTCIKEVVNLIRRPLGAKLFRKKCTQCWSKAGNQIVWVSLIKLSSCEHVLFLWKIWLLFLVETYFIQMVCSKCGNVWIID